MNHYEILGVGPDATEQQIKEAYRREAMKWHPDRHDGAAAKGEADRRFKDLAVAYRTLRNPVDRANYDRQLEQKLRQEFEARQQEQARQQRAQNEQAQQKQTRQEPPQPDFADTGPQFEEQTASNDDANQMFYEQMLDLAFELAGRGFPEFNIFKALVALGCPEALAKAVAAVAAKKVQSGTHNAQSSQDTKSQSASQQADELPKHTGKEEYYRAALGAKNQTYFLHKFKHFDQLGSAGFSWPGAGQFIGGVFWFLHRKMGLNALLYLAVPYGLLFGSYLLLDLEVNGASAALLASELFVGVWYWLFVPARMNAMYYNNINKKILKAKSNFSDITLQLAALKRTGGTSSVVGWLVLIPVVGILVAVALPAYQDYTRRAQVATGFAVGSEAAQKVGDYYAALKTGPGDLAASGFTFAPSKAVKDVAFDSQSGVLTISFQDGFFDAKSLLLVPTVVEGKVAWLCTSTGIAAHHLPQTCKATQSDANARLATINSEAQTKVKNKAEYDEALAGIEARYPQLNPDSPTYNPAAMDWVVERKKMYDQGGDRSPARSLQQAVTDYATALHQNLVRQPNVQAAPPPVDGYISYIKSLSKQDRINQVIADMGVKFPKLSGYLSYTKGEFRAEHPTQANVVESTQTWGFNRNHGPQGGFIVFHNRTNQQLKGIALEIQAEERSCDLKGNVYYMTLEFDRPVAPTSVAGVDFQFPSAIPNANRCMDIVDLIF